VVFGLLREMGGSRSDENPSWLVIAGIVIFVAWLAYEKWHEG
jgi:hypothetical protein